MYQMLKILADVLDIFTDVNNIFIHGCFSTFCFIIINSNYRNIVFSTKYIKVNKNLTFYKYYVKNDK